jgi:cystathionine beta-lyase/cystathionine gamma-synthase
MHPFTAAIHADVHPDVHADPHGDGDSSIAPPLYLTTTFAAADAQAFAEMAGQPRHERYYTRYGNPTLARAAAVIARLEAAPADHGALMFASGMGAISTTALGLLKAGDHVVGQTGHYMGTSKLLTELLPGLGVQVTLVDQTRLDDWRAALRPNTRLLLAETPVNPTMALTDLAGLADIARGAGALLAVDNTFATPINQQPLALGAHLVLHSCTKYFGGHHDVTAGALVASNEVLDRVWRTAIVLGATLGPFDAWLVLRGTRTMPLRVQQQNASALRLAEFLATHPRVATVAYPGLSAHPQHALATRQMSGFGGVIAFAVRGDYAQTAAFVGRLRLARQAVSLGGIETLLVHAAAMWGGTLDDAQLQQAGIAPNAVRVSVGLEDVGDLIRDLDQALRGG